jgi:hypothetical protein
MEGMPDILLVEGTLFQGNEGGGMEGNHHTPFHKMNYLQLSVQA